MTTAEIRCRPESTAEREMTKRGVERMQEGGAGGQMEDRCLRICRGWPREDRVCDAMACEQCRE
eukprot:2248760-Rhodomonas_salina.2